jgi:hypothetical protein
VYSDGTNIDSWQTIKQAWEIPDSYPVSPERVLAAFDAVTEQLGKRWLEEKLGGAGLARSLRALQVVHLGEALAAAKAAGARNLLQKLKRKPTDSATLAEAHVISKLLPTSALVQYEPKGHTKDKRPDIIQRVGELAIQYEVACPEQSNRDKRRQQVTTKWADDIAQVFAAGALDVYLRECELNEGLEQKILAGVAHIQGGTATSDLQIEPGVCLVFDPTGSVLTVPSGQEFKRQILSDGTVIGGELDAAENDRRLVYREKLGFCRPAPGLIVFTKSEVPNAFTNFKLIRIYTETTDARAVLKTIEEASQLSPDTPSFVVLQMGGPTAGIGEWAELVSNEFKSIKHSKPSAVWLRQLTAGHESYTWREVVVTNPYASCPVPNQALANIVGEQVLAKALASR